MAGEHPGRLPQQSRPVGGDQRDLAAVHQGRRAAVGGQRELVRPRPRRHRRRLAVQLGRHPADQVRDEACLPVAPGGRAGRLAVGDRQRVQQLEQAPAADCGGDLRHRDRVVQIPPGRRLRQEKMKPNGCGHEHRVGRAEPDARGHVAGYHLAADAVVARPALAHIVQEGGQQQQVGTRHLAGQRGGPGGGLHQVPVHGVGVQRVALRPVPHPLPVGQQAGHQAFLVQRLPDADRRLAGAEQRDQGVPRLGRPRHRKRRAAGQPAQGARRERQPGLRGGGRGPQHQHRIVLRLGRSGQHDLAVLFDHAVGERLPLGLPLAARAGGQPVGLAERVIRGVGHGPGRAGQRAQQRVPVQQAGHFRDLVLLLEHQAVG